MKLARLLHAIDGFIESGGLLWVMIAAIAACIIVEAIFHGP